MFGQMWAPFSDLPVIRQVSRVSHFFSEKAAGLHSVFKSLSSPEGLQAYKSHIYFRTSNTQRGKLLKKMVMCSFIEHRAQSIVPEKSEQQKMKRWQYK